MLKSMLEAHVDEINANCPCHMGTLLFGGLSIRSKAGEVSIHGTQDETGTSETTATTH